MSELRFNFYDIFGYLVPGLVLGVVVVAPIGGLDHLSAGGTLLGLVLAHAAGMLLAESARSSLNPAGDRLRTDERLAPLRARFVERLHERFGLEAADADEERWQQGVLLARTLLVHRRQAAYAEHFQSLQALSRGLWAALRLAAAWAAGLGAAVVGGWGLGLLALVGLVAARVGGLPDRLLDAEPGPALALPLLVAATSVSGWALSPYSAAPLGALVGTVVVVLLLELLARRARDAHDRFARSFAEEVIRGFVVLEDQRSS